MSEEKNRFSLRKLSVGLASVLVGVSIFGTSQTVKADTVANNQPSSVTNNAQSSDTQENGNTAKSSFLGDNQTNNVKSNLIQTQVEGKKDQTDSLNQNPTNSQEANNSNDLQEKSAEKNIVRTGSLQEPDNQSNYHAEDNSQTQPQNSQKLDLTKNSPKFAKKVLATNLIETNFSPMTNGGFDEATWGKLDVNNWQGSVQDGLYQLTGYTGDLGHIIVPNEADFEKAGKSTTGLQVGITRDTVNSLISRNNQIQTIAFSKTNNQKVKAIGTDWSNAFSVSVDNFVSNLNKFDGSNLDTSNVTDMSSMFADNSISDLTSLAKWDTSKVTNMNEMFYSNQIRDLTPLAHWDTSKVTDMSYMFAYNQISDLTSLVHWDTSKVTDMRSMFTYNGNISNLTPLTNWDTSKVTDMSAMFRGNKVNDLTPLAHWDTSKVTDMSSMFSHNKVSDLTPLAHWDTSKVTNMRWMFGENPDLINLKPIANWNISSVKNNNGLSGLFDSDNKLNLTNINNTSLMQAFLKEPNALVSSTFITNNADLVKATINKDLPDLTKTAKRTITFNIPHATPTKIVQIINYKTIAPVQVQDQIQYYFGRGKIIREIVQTYPVKDSDWQLDTSKQNDAVIIDGVINFKPVTIPHVNGYKAHLVRNKINPAMFMVSFVAVPSEIKPSTPVEVTPSNPSANPDNTNKPANDLQKRVVTELNSNDSGWTMPENNSTYTVEVPDDNTINLSDLVIAEPVHAQTRTQIRVTKRFKLSKKHSIKHLKHRKKAVRTFKKYRL